MNKRPGRLAPKRPASTIIMKEPLNHSIVHARRAGNRILGVAALSLMGVLVLWAQDAKKTPDAETSGTRRRATLAQSLASGSTRR